MKSRTPWFRFEAGYPTNPKTLRMSWEGVALFPLICCMFKAQGWPGETGEDDIDPAVLSRYTGMPLDVVEAGLREVFKVELMVREDGYAVIPAWRTFQPDPGVTERVRKHREKQNETVTKRDETVTTVGNADGTVPDGTVRDETGQEQEPPQSAGPPVIAPKSKTITFNQLQRDSAEEMDGDSVRASCLRVFYRWCQKTGQGKTTQYTSARDGALRRALKHSTEDELIRVVDRFGESRFHTERGYVELTKYVIPSREKVEEWLNKPAGAGRVKEQKHIPYSNNNPEDDAKAIEWARKKGEQI